MRRWLLSSMLIPVLVAPLPIRAAEPATQPAGEARKLAKVWKAGQAVEVKWGGLWQEAKLVRQGNGWWLVQYDKGKRLEWVQPWRLRELGSDVDAPYAKPNFPVKQNEPPPKEKPDGLPDDDTPGATAPNAPGDSKPDAVADNDPFGPKPFSFEVSDVKLDAARQVTLPEKEAWSYTPAEGAKLTVRSPSKLTGRASPAYEVTTVVLQPASAMVGYLDPMEKKPSVELVDLKSGRSRVLPLHDATRPVDRLSTGVLVARAEGFFPGTKHRVDLWDVAAAEAKHVRSFIPYGRGDNDKFVDVQWLAVGAGDVILTSGAGQLTAWKADSAEPIWNAKSKSGSMDVPALSPDRKTVAMVADQWLYLIDVASGDVVSSAKLGTASFREMAFTPSGQRLMGIGEDGSIGTFDLKAGRWDSAIALVWPAMKCVPLSDSLVDAGPAVIDVDQQKMVAALRYDAAGVFASNAGMAGVRGAGAEGQLLLWQPAAVIAQQVKNPPPAEVMNIGRGTKIALDIALTGDAEKVTQASESLRKRLLAMGCVIDDAANLRMVARCEDGKSESRSYQSFRGGRENVTVTERITRLQLMSAGKPIWQAQSTVTAPMFVQINEGQSLAEAVAKTNVHDLDLLTRARIPTTILVGDPSKLPLVLLPALKDR
jgi:hypothetical protein